MKTQCTPLYISRNVRRFAGLLTVMVSVSLQANAALVASYEFEGNGNDSAPAGGTQNLSSMGDGVTFTAPGYAGTPQKLTLAGTDDYLINATNFTANAPAITLAAWFSTTSTGAQSILFSQIVGSAFPQQSAATIEIDPTGNLVGGGRSVNTDNFQLVTGSQFAININTLYFGAVVLDYNNDSISLYLYNSALDTWTQSTGAATFARSSSNSTGNSNFYVGVRGDLLQDFSGSIDEAKVYNEALTQSQVQSLAAVPEPATVVLLLFGGLGCFCLIHRRSTTSVC